MGANSVRRWVKHFKDGNMSIDYSFVAINLELTPLNATWKKLMTSLNITDESL